jgi:hypothetical protein
MDSWCALVYSDNELYGFIKVREFFSRRETITRISQEGLRSMGLVVALYVNVL